MPRIKLELNKDDFKNKLGIKNGKDGKTPTKKELIDIIKPLIPEPKKEIIIEKTEVIKEQPINIENKETGVSIVDKINDLRTDRSQYKIDASHIKNLPKATQQIIQRYGGSSDEKVKLNSSDHTAGYLDDKIVEGGYLDDYAKLAIEITTTDFLTAYSASTLIPNQWYLLTDYKTVANIASSTEYHIADVEPIYVLALGVNEIAPTAYSKTHPEELLTFDPTQEIYYDYLNNYGELGDTFNEFDITGVNNVLTLDTTTFANYRPESLYLYLELFEPMFGVSYIEIYQNQDDYWTYNPATNEFTIDLIDAWLYDEYSGGESQRGYFTYTVEDSNTIRIQHSELTSSQIYGFTNGYMYINDGSNEVEINPSNLGTAWEVVGDNIVLLDSELDLESEDLYIENNIYIKGVPAESFIDVGGGAYINMEYSFDSGYVKDGIILSRHHIPRELEVACDYRGQKFRRYKALATTWTAGTSTKDTIYRYSGYIWACLADTTTSPVFNNGLLWIRLFNDDYVMSNTYITFNPIGHNFTVYYDPATYYDYDAINLTSLDSETYAFKTKISGYGSYGFDVVLPILNSATFNSEINGYKSIIRNGASESKLSLYNSIIDYTQNAKMDKFDNSIAQAVQQSNIKSVSSCVFSQGVTNVTVDGMQSTVVATSNFSNSVIGVITYSIFRHNFYYNKATSLQNINARGSFTNNTLNVMIGCQTEMFDSNIAYSDLNYTNFGNSALRNTFMTRCYGSSDSVRQTFGYLADNVFGSTVALNYFHATSQVYGNTFLGGMSNSFTTAVPSHPLFNISDNFCAGRFAYQNGAGCGSIEGNVFLRTVYKLTFNNTGTGNTPVRFRYNVCLNSFSDINGAIRFYHTVGSTIESNTFYETFDTVDFYNGVIASNKFLGKVSSYSTTRTVMGTNSATIVIGNNTFGGKIVGQTFNYNLSNIVDYRTWGDSGTTTTGVTDQTYFNNVNTSVKVVTNTYTILVKDHTIIGNKSTAFTITLPTAVVGQEFIIKNIGAGVITLEGAGSDTIDGSLNKTINQLDAITVKCSAANTWQIISNYNLLNITAGNGITVDNTDPSNTVISTSFDINDYQDKSINSDVEIINQSDTVYSYAHGTAQKGDVMFMTSRTSPAVLTRFNNPDDLEDYDQVTLTGYNNGESLIYDAMNDKLYCYVWNADSHLRILSIDPDTLAWSSVFDSSTINGGDSAAMVTDGGYVYVATYTNPSTLVKIKISDWSVDAQETWTNGNKAHAMGLFEYSDRTEIYAVGAFNSYLAKIDPSDLSYTEVDLETSFLTDDLCIKNVNNTYSYIYIGSESSDITLHPNEKNVRIKSDDLSFTKFWGRATYGVKCIGDDLYSFSYDGTITKYVNSDITNWKLFFIDAKPNEMFYSDGRIFVTDWIPSAKLYEVEFPDDVIVNGVGSVSLGRGAEASGNLSTAIGLQSKVTGEQSTAIGNYSNTTGDRSTAIGYNVKCSGKHSVAIGMGAKLGTAGLEIDNDEDDTLLIATSDEYGVITEHMRFRTDGGATEVKSDIVSTNNISAAQGIKIPSDYDSARFGEEDDATIKYDGTNLVINPQEVGSGATVFVGNVGIGTTSPDTKLQVVGTVKFGEDTTNYSEFESDGTFKMNGSATVWEDLRFPATAINPAGAPSAMVFDTTNIGFTAGASGTQVIAIIAQLPHSWKEGSDIYPHIHWEPITTNTGNVLWRLEYKWTNIGDTEPAGFTTLDVLDAGDGTALKHQMASFAAMSGAGKTISSIISIKISRIGGDATDTYTGDALLKEFDIHYEMDTLGSRSEYTK